jgi:hypothetical protein
VRDPAVGFKLTTKEKEFNHKERKGYFFVTFVRFVVKAFASRASPANPEGWLCQRLGLA